MRYLNKYEMGVSENGDVDIEYLGKYFYMTTIGEIVEEIDELESRDLPLSMEDQKILDHLNEVANEALLIQHAFRNKTREVANREII